MGFLAMQEEDQFLEAAFEQLPDMPKLLLEIIDV
tara:strand:- start:422 stop:523 length:102 start_codon:yes stop_codon:yes gene_type:complete